MSVTESNPEIINYPPSIGTDLIRLEKEINAGGSVIAFGTPVAVGTANSAGVASTAARSDHVHTHGSQTTPTHHAAATDSANGFMSSADKIKLDGLLVQSEQASLVNGGATIAANITAASVVLTQLTDIGTIDMANFRGIQVLNQVVGTPGSFDLKVLDNNGGAMAGVDCTVDWFVFG